MFLCIICLRTDKQIKLVSDLLEQFHDQLCHYADITMGFSCYCCIECEYLLTKFYKFKEKCVKALQVYQTWLKTKDSEKQTLNHLFKLLPPTSLGMWTTDRNKIGNFTIQEENYDAVITNTNIKEFDNIKLEEDNTDKSDNILFEDDEEISNNDIKINLLPTVLEVENVTINIPKSEQINLTNDNLVTEKHIKNPNKDVEDENNKILDKVKEADEQFESVFDIIYLTSYKMKLDEFENRKTYECYVNADFKCEICYTGFKSLKHKEYHAMKWHTEKPGRVCCRICKRWISKRRSQHNPFHAVVYKCKLCPLVSYLRDSMYNHFEWHKGKKYHCEECDFTYKSISAYRTHLGKSHRQGRHVCAGCGRGFNSKQGLLIHSSTSSHCTVRQENVAEGGVRCEECDVTLPSQQVYDAHIADMHLPRRLSRRRVKINSSGLPEYESSNHPALMARKNKRHRLPQHKCRLCDQVGRSFSWLQLHFKTEHPNEDINVLYADKRPYLCDICGVGFTKVYALRDHMFVHTGDRPFQCDLCTKQFRNSNHLRAHRVRHFPSTRSCEHCGKQFKSHSNLYNHMKIHTGKKNYKCEICDKAFLHKGSVKEHVKGVHFNIRRTRKRGAREGAAGTGGKRKREDETMIPEPDIDSGESTCSEL